jgi:hypothetical protein
MKEYRDAKKAMEKADEIERKSIMKGMRERGKMAEDVKTGGRLGGVGRVSSENRVNGGGGRSGLLREAILNNVRGIQGGT